MPKVFEKNTKIKIIEYGCEDHLAKPIIDTIKGHIHKISKRIAA